MVEYGTRERRTMGVALCARRGVLCREGVLGVVLDGRVFRADDDSCSVVLFGDVALAMVNGEVCFFLSETWSGDCLLLLRRDGDFLGVSSERRVKGCSFAAETVSSRTVCVDSTASG